MNRYLLYIMLVPLLALAGIQERVDALLLARHGKVQTRFEKYSLKPALKKEIESQSKQRFLKKFVFLWKIETDNSGKKLAIVDAVRAKSAFITMMATFDSTNHVVEIDILDYNGDHGRKVMNSNWLAQFTGKGAESELIIGNDVDAVTGATFSAAAISKAVKRWALLAQHIEH
jgi:Na+-translocating ferredoxin:NAD+ oxidoreductase RnfG subunit